MIFASLLITVSLVGATAQADFVPVANEALTVDLEIDGYVNGFMDPSRMLTFKGCTLERDAAYTYALMVEAAARDGVTLQPLECYRTYYQQRAAFERRCPYTDVPVYETDRITGEKYPVGTKSVRVCTGPPTARAGESNHGWGRAVDFGVNQRTLGCRDRAFIWLQSNAYEFGWVHPYWAQCGLKTAEPWHWEYASLDGFNLLPLTIINQDLLQVVE
ncbi:MAG: M15 family metallopeptidase [Acidimicrobiia bacterium]|nr:M15 family metallopeptidase [Acidimicrobiia bacterium]